MPNALDPWDGKIVDFVTPKSEKFAATTHDVPAYVRKVGRAAAVNTDVHSKPLYHTPPLESVLPGTRDSYGVYAGRHPKTGAKLYRSKRLGFEQLWAQNAWRFPTDFTQWDVVASAAGRYYNTGVIDQIGRAAGAWDEPTYELDYNDSGNVNRAKQVVGIGLDAAFGSSPGAAGFLLKRAAKKGSTYGAGAKGFKGFLRDSSKSLKKAGKAAGYVGAALTLADIGIAAKSANDWVLYDKYYNLVDDTNKDWHGGQAPGFKYTPEEGWQNVWTRFSGKNLAYVKKQKLRAAARAAQIKALEDQIQAQNEAKKAAGMREYQDIKKSNWTPGGTAQPNGVKRTVEKIKNTLDYKVKTAKEARRRRQAQKQNRARQSGR